MEPAVRLTGARVARSAQRSEFLDLTIRDARILPFDAALDTTRDYDLSGHLLLPGLINAHDHLEFNLFPRLGPGPWPNASEWASAIYRPTESPLEEHLKIPKRVRLFWGGIKNLLSGVTTVAHHNPWEAKVFARGFPVRVLKRFGWAHSLDFSQSVAEAYRKTPAGWSFIVHAGEGTDERAQAEIPKLDFLGVLGPSTVLVHAITATENDIATMRDRAVSVIWCPSSNLFTIGRTLSAAAIHSGIPVALATDSALTGEGDLVDEMRIACNLEIVSLEEIYEMVTSRAAQALRLSFGQGHIREGGMADLVAVKDRGQAPAEALAELNPQMVMIGGKITLSSQDLATRLKPLRDFHPISLEGRGRWLIHADVPALYAAAAAELGDNVFLAGKRVCP